MRDDEEERHYGRGNERITNKKKYEYKEGKVKNE